MKIPYAFLAKSVERDEAGQVTAVGVGINLIVARSFPVVQEKLALLIGISPALIECDREHTLTMEMIDSDGAVLAHAQPMKFTPQRDPGAPYRAIGGQINASLDGVAFPKAGDYAVHIAVDHIELGVIPLYVRQFMGTLPAQ